MSSALDALTWRYATKQYDPTKTLSDEQRHLIMESLRLAPSSFGLQPWVFVHVTDPAVRAQMSAAAYNQSQVTSASDLFVLCSRTSLDEAYVDRFIQSTAAARNVPVESLAGFHKFLLGSVMGRTPEELRAWNASQVYIALGVALTVAAQERIDASPMEGFDKKRVDEILNLPASGLESQLLLAVGFRSDADATQHYPKVRFSAEDVFRKA